MREQHEHRSDREHEPERGAHDARRAKPSQAEGPDPAHPDTVHVEAAEGHPSQAEGEVGDEDAGVPDRSPGED